MITVELRGRLGNQMFQYSLCRVIAEKNNFNFYVSKNGAHYNQNISNYFNLDMGVVDGDIRYRHDEDISSQAYDENLFKINDFTLLSGFFQTEKYFYGYEDKIKKWFNLEKSETVNEFLKKYPVDEYCYIHFRGGDYKDMTEWFLPLAYYENAINEILKIKNNLKFLIITDNIEDAKLYFKNYDIISNNMMDDFVLLKESKYCIIPNSSFSWWAAWLSDKIITIAPNRWFNYNKPELNFSPVDVKTNKFTYI